MSTTLDRPVFNPTKYTIRVRIGLDYRFDELRILRRYLADGRIGPNDNVSSSDNDLYILVGDLTNETDEAFDARLAAATERLPPRSAHPTHDPFERMKARQRARIRKSPEQRRPILPLKEFIRTMFG